mmetsp:Transcript_40205/g.104806  ORF Transcript_40205/g.104806 Transcript_40205/m.104806 type:complete len:292 (-) Transcript_40205:209-1084(-)
MSAAPISSHHSLTLSRCFAMPITRSQSRTPGTASRMRTTFIHCSSSSSMSLGTLQSASSASSPRSISNPAVAAGVAVRPSVLKDFGGKSLPSSVCRARQRRRLAPCSRASDATNRINSISTSGPSARQSSPTQKSSLTLELSGSRAQRASAAPRCVPTRAVIRRAAVAWSSPKRIARSSAAVSSSAPFSAANSSKLSRVSALSGASDRQVRQAPRPLKMRFRAGTTTRALLSAAMPFLSKPADLLALFMFQRLLSMNAFSTLSDMSITLYSFRVSLSNGPSNIGTSSMGIS